MPKPGLSFLQADFVFHLYVSSSTLFNLFWFVGDRTVATTMTGVQNEVVSVRLRLHRFYTHAC